MWKLKGKVISKKTKILVFLFFFLILLSLIFRPVLRDIGDYCIIDSQCESGICLMRLCRSSTLFCGDLFCNNDETCETCPRDCGECFDRIGASCNENVTCPSGYCVHNICRETNTHCGDDFCDEGESSETCPEDCYPGEAWWI